MIGQGGAINRYCARLAGLYPTDPVEATYCDMYLEEVMDIFGGFFKVSESIMYRIQESTCDMFIMASAYI